MGTNTRTILVSAGGTQAGWHIVETVRKSFKGLFNVVVCDTNDRHRVAASTMADSFFTVPPVSSRGFVQAMLAVLAKERPSWYIPILDDEQYVIPEDHPEITRLGIRSMAVSAKVGFILRNKRRLGAYLEHHGVHVPPELSDFSKAGSFSRRVFVKPVSGHGSLGAFATDVKGAQRYIGSRRYLVQEALPGPEVTVDVFHGGGSISAVCRERLETKGGVCTKARVFHDATLMRVAEQICSSLRMPSAFCFQVMRDTTGAWVVTDVNPRIGAGTSMSATVGWSAVKALLASLLGRPTTRYLKMPETDRYVTRVYNDVLMPL